jgi:hypothetical protein
MRLFGFLRPDQGLRDQVQALEERLAVLEREMHPTRLIEWVELTEKLKRYLQRLSAVEQRQKQREGEGSGSADPVIRAVLSSKFPRSQGG